MVDTFRNGSSFLEGSSFGMFVLEGIVSVGLHSLPKLPYKGEGSLDSALKAYLFEKDLIQVDEDKIYLTNKGAALYSKLVKLVKKEAGI